MITIDCGGGRSVKLHEWTRYSSKLDSPSVRIWCRYQGNEYAVIAKIEEGKSMTEAREKAHKILEAAVKAETPGEVVI